MTEPRHGRLIVLLALTQGCTCISLDDLQAGVGGGLSSSGAAGPGGQGPGPGGADTTSNGASSVNGGTGPGGSSNGGAPNGGGGGGPGPGGGGAGGGAEDTYVGCVLADTPQIYYRMDSATMFEPNLGTFGGSATYFNSVVSAPALTYPFGGLTAKKFNALSDLEEDTPQFMGGFEHVSIEAWVRIGSTITVGDSFHNIFEASSPGLVAIGIQPRFDQSGVDQLFFSLQNGERQTFDNGNFIMQPNEVFHIVAVYRQSAIPPTTSDDMLIYVNGALTSLPATGSQISMGAMGTLRIGGTDFGSTADGAEIDEFAMYTYELTPADIAAHYNAGTTGVCQ